MTEFELTELAFMEKSHLIELEMVTQGYVATLQTEATILLSFIFGYLLVAHFIGKDLTRVQVSIINTLYLLTVISDLFVYKGLYESITLSSQRMIDEGSREVYQLAIVGTPTGLKFVVSAYALMIVASIYFMWSVRDQVSERENEVVSSTMAKMGLK